MYTAGIDIGSSSAKAVILRDKEMVAWHVQQTGPDSMESARSIFDVVLSESGLSAGSIGHIIATGYGRINVPFADGHVTEISCHAKGANFVLPSVRCILDIGGQDSKAIRCDGKGRVTNFAMNDKCAAGTGRHLDRVATALKTPVEKVGPLSMNIVEQAAKINSTCTVFAQVDVIRLVRKGVHLNDILAGTCDAIASRIVELVDRIGLEADFMMTGGVAKNIGVVNRLEEKLGVKPHIPEEPQIIGALGAAILALEKALE
ncbi:MAG: 2-hydroxyglutaryl-CoA dehydratase [Deltaproteobacteria bacterium]|nr:2-hydroxyglutaryl-CoA dehydratase [Deltaproteobacteria bacterium]